MWAICLKSIESEGQDGFQPPDIHLLHGGVDIRIYCVSPDRDEHNKSKYCPIGEAESTIMEKKTKLDVGRKAFYKGAGTHRRWEAPL